MSALIWDDRPELDRPVIIAAFAGWNDAGDAATGAVRQFIDQWNAVPFADIDAEDFFDFTETRPMVRMENGTERRIDWPANTFYAGRINSRGRDVILLDGTEPQLKWRTFSEAILEVADTFDASRIITLGALLADVPHTRPSPAIASSSDTELLEQFSLMASRYEGPTGITGVINEAATSEGYSSVSIWASVPHYVSGTPSPKAMLALVQKTTEILDVPFNVDELISASAQYQEQVSEVVEDDEDMVSYVQSLEEATDIEDSAAEDLVQEAQRFLRDQ